jgi:membrane protease subunit HflK
MSWNKGSGNNSGPWGNRPTGGGSGGGGGVPPRRPQGGNGGTPPPDLDDYLRRIQDNLRNMFGGDGGGRAFVLVLLGVLLVWAATGIYRVEAGEKGVVLRFGEYSKTVDSGLHYHLPYPIEIVSTPDVSVINSVEVGYRGGNPRFESGTLKDESQMLTGDLNLVDLDFEVQWKIDGTVPEKFLFNVRNAEETVKPVAESAMREVVGQMELEKILTTGQNEAATRTQRIMQQVLDSYDAGIEVVSVNIRKPDVPQPVINAFQDVKKAEQDRETTISVAEKYANDVIPRARGQAVAMEQEAKAYKARIVNAAKGDVSRFLAILNEYKDAEFVTRRRIYLETMEEVFDGMEKIIIDDKGAKTGVLPYLPLQQLQSRNKQKSDGGMAQ